MESQQNDALMSLFQKFPSAESLIIYKNGRVIFDAHNEHPYDPLPSRVIRKSLSAFLRVLNKPHDTFTEEINSCHNLRSATKSIVSILLGIALDQAAIIGINRSIFDYLPERYAHIDRHKHSITIRHLLTMTSGLASIESGMNAFKLLAGDGDWVRHILHMPSVNKPGEKFYYNSANAHLLSAIISFATQISTQDFARKYLFEPLGIRDYFWEKDLAGTHFGAAIFFYHPRTWQKSDCSISIMDYGKTRPSFQAIG